MIAAGLQLMVLGMTIVFTFLILLVFLMNIMSAILRRIEPAPALAAPTGSPATGAPAGSIDAHIPAILAAVVAHRKRTGRTHSTQ